MLVVLAGLLIALSIGPIEAIAAQRTFVASNGNDANPCSLVLPCRGFAAAITHTDPDGEIIVLDSAGYGAVTITSGVSIIAPAGVYGGLSVFSGQDGVTVNGGGVKVVLRGLAINGQGGSHGVRVIQAAQVHIEDCVISNMAGDGVRAEAGAVYVANSVLRGNAFGAHVTGASARLSMDATRVAHNINRGVFAEAGSIAIDRSQIENNGNAGMEVNPAAASTVRASIRDTSFAGNNGNGLLALAESAGDVVNVTVERASAWKNAVDGFGAQTFSSGVVAFILSDSAASENGQHGFTVTGAGTTAAVAGSTLSHNVGSGMLQSSGALLRSHSNNALSGNGGADASGTVTPIGLQ